MLRYALLLMFLIINISSFAQRDSTKQRGIPKGTIVINAALGTNSNIWNAAGGIGEPDGANLISASPVYILSIDYSISRKHSLGIILGYQQYVGNPSGYNYPGYSYGQAASFVTVNTSVSYAELRYLWHISKSQNGDFYIGLQAGIGYINQYTYETNSYVITPNTYHNFSPYTTRGIGPNAQLLMGYRRYVIKNIGLHLEIAYGAPFLIQGGLTYRFSTVKQ